MKKCDELTGKGCLWKADLEEMLFVLLARDPAAPATIRYWVEERVRLGKNELGDSQTKEALACAEHMEEQHAIRERGSDG